MRPHRHLVAVGEVASIGRVTLQEKREAVKREDFGIATQKIQAVHVGRREGMLVIHALELAAHSVQLHWEPRKHWRS